MARSLESSIIIQAPIGRVWSVLTDLPGHQTWDPFLRRIDGSLADGATLSLFMWIQGKGQQNYRVRVTSLQPMRRFAWIGHFHVPGLIDGNHAFELEEVSPQKTRLCHVERFTGLLVPFVWRSFLLRHLKPSFEALDANLKAYCETQALPFELH